MPPTMAWKAMMPVSAMAVFVGQNKMVTPKAMATRPRASRSETLFANNLLVCIRHPFGWLCHCTCPHNAGECRRNTSHGNVREPGRTPKRHRSATCAIERLAGSVGDGVPPRSDLERVGRQVIDAYLAGLGLVPEGAVPKVSVARRTAAGGQ